MFDGRIVEDFKLATGTFVSAGPLRATVIAASDPCVQDVVVAGIDRDEIGIPIFPRLDACRAGAGRARDACVFAVAGRSVACERQRRRRYADQLRGRGRVRARQRSRPEKAVPLALKKGQPGTPAFRAGLKEALETMGRTPVSQGVLNDTSADHFGYTPETGVLLTIDKGDWKLVPTK